MLDPFQDLRTKVLCVHTVSITIVAQSIRTRHDGVSGPRDGFEILSAVASPIDAHESPRAGSGVSLAASVALTHVRARGFP